MSIPIPTDIRTEPLNEDKAHTPILLGKANNPAYKGVLKELLVSEEEVAKLKAESVKFISWDLTERQICDLELLLNGGFSPLNGFLNQNDYESVVNNLRLADGTLWPMPICLDVPEDFTKKIKIGEKIALRDVEGKMLAVLTVESIYKPNKALEAEKVFGSPDDRCHPAIDFLFTQVHDYYIGGAIQGIELPTHYDYCNLRNTPRELRKKIDQVGWGNIVAFQTRNPLHRSHRELTLRAAQEANAGILLHPVVGMTKPGDVDHHTRVRCYVEICKYYPKDLVMLSLLPLAMRMAGPREALWHAIIRKNYGCTYFIVGRDHAGPGDNKHGQPFYDPYAAQTLVNEHKAEIGIEVLVYQQVVYCQDTSSYLCMDEVPEGARVLNISGTELRRRLVSGTEIPEWFSYPSVVKILRQTYPPRSKQGFTIWLTGLSGAGKSTIANALRVALLEQSNRDVTLLDGDEVRKYLSTELGFSKEHRDLNIKRIGYVASLITRNGGVAICAAISPYREVRQFVRKIINPYGGFFEIYVSTPISTCEERDVKGLYAKARQGIIKGFTGVDDPYEEPGNPEMILDTSKLSVLAAVHQIMQHLESEGFIGTEE